MTHAVVLFAASKAIGMPVPPGLHAACKNGPLEPRIRMLYEQPGFWRGAASVRQEAAQVAYANGQRHEGDRQSMAAGFYEKVAEMAVAYVENLETVVCAGTEDDETRRAERDALDPNLVSSFDFEDDRDAVRFLAAERDQFSS